VDFQSIKVKQIDLKWGPLLIKNRQYNANASLLNTIEVMIFCCCDISL